MGLWNSQLQLKCQNRGVLQERPVVFLPVDYVVDNRLLRGLIMDISETGARIENTISLMPGDFATMTFMEFHSMGPVKTRARVVRALDNGFAVHFDNLTSLQEESLASFIALE
jgi:hypothetical protein